MSAKANSYRAEWMEEGVKHENDFDTATSVRKFFHITPYRLLKILNDEEHGPYGKVELLHVSTIPSIYKYKSYQSHHCDVCGYDIVYSARRIHNASKRHLNKVKSLSDENPPKPEEAAP